jgi:hypothetical protein
MLSPPDFFAHSVRNKPSATSSPKFMPGEPLAKICKNFFVTNLRDDLFESSLVRMLTLVSEVIEERLD